MEINGRVYTAKMINATISALRTLIEVTAPADAILALIEATVTQSNSETSTQEHVAITRKTVAGAGTSHVPVRHQSGDAAFGGTCQVDGTIGTLGEELVSEDFNIVGGWMWVPTPPRYIIVPPSGIIGLQLWAPEAAMEVNATLTFVEIG